MKDAKRRQFALPEKQAPMKLHSDIPTQTPRDAATVVLLREGTQGPEVFLIKRHSASQVLGGAYVFPGGQLDPADGATPPEHLNQTPQALHTKLGEPETAAEKAVGLFVAALRETYEEAGVLFTETPADVPRGATADFHRLLGVHGLRLNVAALQPWVRWITPRMPSLSSRRFDARFFLAPMPAEQTALHDNVEATASAWLRPRHALEQYWCHAIELAPPQIMGLAYLARYDSVRGILNAAAACAPATILPESHDHNGQRVVCYPGDPQHSVPGRALPGPTRLVWREQRFEPEAGFDALWAD